MLISTVHICVYPRKPTILTMLGVQTVFDPQLTLQIAKVKKCSWFNAQIIEISSEFNDSGLRADHVELTLV